MKQDLRRIDTEKSSKFYNNPLIIEEVNEGRFYFSKVYSLCTSDIANNKIDLQSNFNGSNTFGTTKISSKQG